MAAQFGATRRDTEQRLPTATRVKNKAPSDRQITAEQILREAKEIRLEDDNYRAPKQFINDPDELASYHLRKRKEFEDLVRRVGRFSMSAWTKVRRWWWGDLANAWVRGLQRSMRPSN
jgi:crooked neck